MKRIDRVHKCALDLLLQQETESVPIGITATEISNQLGILRCDCSSDLNKLCQSGFLKKTNTRPVRFLLSSPTNRTDRAKQQTMPNTSQPDEHIVQDAAAVLNGHPERPDILERFAAENPSLRYAVQTAKAAVSYPPHGLNMLITGETGVGKNHLAELIWKYALEKKIFGEKAALPFVSFSCAEYADNPQLLLSQLFGYKKGAFTGAVESKAGLVEEANGGIFFLDEIHRLPPTGQEMLFTLIDKGTIRRLGDTIDRPIDIMLLCATTEDLNTALLKTFLRRIPVAVHLPSLAHRSLEEKLHFIEYFLQQAAERTGMSVYLMPQALRSLLQYNPPGNVGDLKNTLNLCCAKAYLNCIADREKQHCGENATLKNRQMQIGLLELPQKVYYQESPESAELHTLPSEYLRNGIVIRSTATGRSSEGKLLSEASPNEASNLYLFIERRNHSYRQLRMDHEEVTKRVSEDLEAYCDNIMRRMNASEARVPDLIDNIPAKYRDIALDILATAEKQFRCVYSSGVLLAFALHLWQFCQRHDSGEIIYNPDLRNIKKKYYLEMHFLAAMQEKLQAWFRFQIPEDELGFWAIFLHQHEPADVQTQICLLLAAACPQLGSIMALQINLEQKKR